jgi:hypothetical protein
LLETENTMKKVMIVGLWLTGIMSSPAQTEEGTRSLPHFTKITASPRINVVLVKGDKESIRLSCTRIDPSQVNVRVSGKRLRIYLDHARVVEKPEHTIHGHHSKFQSMYHDVVVTAYVTYRELKDIEIRGDQEFVCQDEISSRKLKLRAYGETDIQLGTVNTGKFKASLYGENKLSIRAGGSEFQVYRLFGQNRIDTRGLKSESVSTRIYGEGRLSVSVSDQLHIHAIGEPEIHVTGSPTISKGLVIGHADIRRQ